MKKSILLSGLGVLFMALNPMFAAPIEPVPSERPNLQQLRQIERRYGMFIHFGINTFHDQEWTDGSKPASSYNPSSIDAAQWIRIAKDAGMKYVILVAKHHEGFCLWDSKLTEYDVASSGNHTNVIEAVAQECKRQGIGLGLYYSLWDRKQNPDANNPSLDADYNRYMIHQINELIDITSKYTPLVEFWFDGSWAKPSWRWPIQDLYSAIKSREPQCQIGINWTIGQPGSPDGKTQETKILPQDQKNGDPIRYFPSDFRLGDPLLPKDSDPKLFTHNGKTYYLPWESTVCLSGKWFYNTKDTQRKSLDELIQLYKKATAQDNILIINVPPNRSGKMSLEDANLLKQLRAKLNI